ncbi:glycosyltransferase [Cochleicola gelatinilyticus]|uniref:Glycosyltransferase n=1 Tax=Cochleicola gelatinilyticus TaxID=1763537 RepID=A0A167IS91_9FLAO|nr:glycosyltransferase [Cochleicola gelatinilyticus]OAB79963.1 glycosyltransferase [Cochleicola gelatinilyticus]
MATSKTILVAPLHWGLGHATRCVPIIRALLESGHKVLIASDGAALLLLRKEFPKLLYVELPSYNITYPKNGRYFKWKLFLKLPKLHQTISEEHKIIKKLVSENKINGIISDNRLGVYSKDVPSVFITHQLKVLSGNTSLLSSKLHQNYIKKFNICWVPDIDSDQNLSGTMSRLDNAPFPIRYMGILSRMKRRTLPKKYDILILLSGPEPQRTLLEKTLLNIFKNSSKHILCVRGVIEEKKDRQCHGTIEVVNFMTGNELETVINESDLIISRSGYTTVMDLAAMGKKALFIPTPGQYEQEYLADRLEKLKIAPYCEQNEFLIDSLNLLENYSGFHGFEQAVDLKKLFVLFEGK